MKKIGGIESLSFDLAKNLSDKNYKITLSSNCNKTYYRNKIRNLPLQLIKKNPKKYNFHFIISSNDSTIFSLYPDSKKFLWLHNPLQIEKSFRKWQFFHILNNRPTVVFVSDYLRKITSSFYFFKQKVVIPNFLTSNFTTNIKIKKRKPIFVWSVQRDKGLLVTIDMWINRIHPISSNAKFYILGMNKNPTKYKKRYLESKNIFFLGRVSKTKLRNIYLVATGMICLGYDETFCLNALEANSCGLPVITFGKTALNELIKNNYNGFIVNDFNELSDKILSFLKINSKNEKKIRSNSLSFSKKYHPNNVTYKWLKLLK
ncbi:glycosyltransferase [Candidatus Pelagibacter sp.]|nr:glycosyltransferase [Candidatus Pelagibacter sp.]